MNGPFQRSAPAAPEAAAGAGPRLLWVSRFALSERDPSALRLTAHAQSTWLAFGRGRPSWQHELEAEVELELSLSAGGRRLGFLRPGASLSIDGLGEGRLRPVGSVFLGFEPTH